MYDYNCPDCNDTKLQSDKNARKINEVIDQVNALIQVNNDTVDFIEEKVEEVLQSNLNLFKPTFGFNCFGSPCSDCKTLDEQITMFNQMIDIGVEEISLCLNIIENSDGTMYNNDDNDMIDKSVRYCIDNNIKISKIHLYVNQEFDTVTSNFNTNYKAIVRSVAQNLTFPILLVQNTIILLIQDPCITQGYPEKVTFQNQFGIKILIQINTAANRLIAFFFCL